LTFLKKIIRVSFFFWQRITGKWPSFSALSISDTHISNEGSTGVINNSITLAYRDNSLIDLIGWKSLLSMRTALME
jgi:hypothetical protein